MSGRTLDELIAQAVRRVDAMTDAERARMKADQRASYIRAMTTPCEHGVLDFEQCGACRAVPPKVPDHAG